MSPFSKYLHELRRRHQLRQTELAVAMGYDQTYLSALESGTKGPPSRGFVEKLIAVLALDDDEQRELNDAVAASDRKLTLSANSPLELYLLFQELRDTLDQLGPDDILLFRQMLKTCTRPAPWSPERFQRQRRRAAQGIVREEAAM